MRAFAFQSGKASSLGALPDQAPERGFVWLCLERPEFIARLDAWQAVAQRLGGAALLDLHVQDLASDGHSSDHDATSVYDLIVFRRLQAPDEATDVQAPEEGPEQLATHAVGLVVFDRLLISVHPPGCHTADDAIRQLDPGTVAAGDARGGAARWRQVRSPAGLALLVMSNIVDAYPKLRKTLAERLQGSQRDLLHPRPGPAVWSGLMATREQVRLLQDHCEDQQDALQEWLDALREKPLASPHTDATQARRHQDHLMAHARDVMERLERVLGHTRRLEQAAETAVQIHFNAQGQRTNDIMLTLTAITAVFLPLNLFTGFFGMNFDGLPLLHSRVGMWTTFALMVALVMVILVLFWRKHLLPAPMPPERRRRDP